MCSFHLFFEKRTDQATETKRPPILEELILVLQRARTVLKQSPTTASSSLTMKWEERERETMKRKERKERETMQRMESLSQWSLKDFFMFVHLFLEKRTNESKATETKWPPILEEFILVLQRARTVLKVVNLEQSLLDAARNHQPVLGDILRDLSWCVYQIFESNVDKKTAVELGVPDIIHLCLTERYLADSVPLITILMNLRILVGIAVTLYKSEEKEFGASQIEQLDWSNTPLVQLPPGLDLDRLGEIEDLAIDDADDLGEGSEGKVYKRTWRKTDFVAVKEVSLDTLTQAFNSLVLGDTIVGEKYRGGESFGLDRELKVLQRFKHPNVVELKGFTRKVRAGKYGLVMELMATSLENIIAAVADGEKGEGPPFVELVCIDILLQIARGMKFLHKSGLMHRDLKPSNVLVDFPFDLSVNAGSLDYLTVKLADFGLSKPDNAMPDYGMGSHSCYRGSTYYMAPEVRMRGKSLTMYSRKADVFSFGTTCFYVATGISCPQGVEGKSAFYQKITEGDLEGLLIPGCPTYLVPMIKRCWHADPNERPEFSEICRSLEKMKRRAFLGVPLSEEGDDAYESWLEQEFLAIEEGRRAPLSRRCLHHVMMEDDKTADIMCKTLRDMLLSVCPYTFTGCKTYLRPYSFTALLGKRLRDMLRKILGHSARSMPVLEETLKVPGDHLDHVMAEVEPQLIDLKLMVHEGFAYDAVLRGLVTECLVERFGRTELRPYLEEWTDRARNALLGLTVSGANTSYLVCSSPYNVMLNMAYNLCATHMHARIRQFLGEAAIQSQRILHE